MQTIETEHGPVKVLDPTEEILIELQKRLTYGFVPLGQDYQGYRYGFVVKCGDKEIPCIKQQPIDMDRSTAMRIMNLHGVLIVDTYCKFISKNLDCAYYATPYFKDKGDNRFESGIAHFIFPGDSLESDVDLGIGRSVTPYDGELGSGATKLLMDYVKEFQSHFDDKFRIQYIGLDVRTRSQLGSLVSGFMLLGNKLIFHGAKVSGEDPRFGIIARHGIDSVWHIPSLPMTISEDQLKKD